MVWVPRVSKALAECSLDPGLESEPKSDPLPPALHQQDQLIIIPSKYKSNGINNFHAFDHFRSEALIKVESLENQYSNSDHDSSSPNPIFTQAFVREEGCPACCIYKVTETVLHKKSAEIRDVYSSFVDHERRNRWKIVLRGRSRTKDAIAPTVESELKLYMRQLIECFRDSVFRLAIRPSYLRPRSPSNSGFFQINQIRSATSLSYRRPQSFTLPGRYNSSPRYPSSWGSINRFGFDGRPLSRWIEVAYNAEDPTNVQIYYEFEERIYEVSGTMVKPRDRAYKAVLDLLVQMMEICITLPYDTINGALPVGVIQFDTTAEASTVPLPDSEDKELHEPAREDGWETGRNVVRMVKRCAKKFWSLRYWDNSTSNCKYWLCYIVPHAYCTKLFANQLTYALHRSSTN